MQIPDFVIPLLIGFLIQLIKIIIDFVNEKTFKIDNARRAGGFPSVHSGISSSLVVLFFLKYGIYSQYFTIGIIFGLLFWYDAMNIRYEAGKHAQEINKLKLTLKDIVSFKDKSLNLTERLGHTFFEVVGGIVIGSILTIIVYYYLLN